MAGERIPGPVCQVERPVWVDDGTMCVASSATAGPTGISSGVLDSVSYSSGMVTRSVSITVRAETTWDAAVRDLYNQSAEAIAAQARDLMLSGRMTSDEAANWVAGQRKALIVATRAESSPLGRVIAEWIKPVKGLKGVADLKALGENAAGIIESSGRTDPWVNKVAMQARYGGPALLVVGLSFSAYNIASAPYQEQWNAAAREVGSWPCTLGLGWAGSAAGDFVYRSLETSEAAAAGAGGRKQ